MRFALQVTLSDGFVFMLDQKHETEAQANREATHYITHYSDPCGVGAKVSYIAIHDLHHWVMQ